MFIAGTMITCPRTMLGSSVRASSQSATGPSYSSPWAPPVKSTRGPSPFFTDAIGTTTAPQAERLLGLARRGA